MKPILRRMIAIFACLLLLVAPIALAEGQEELGANAFPEEDIDDFADNLAGDDGLTLDDEDVNPPTGDLETAPEPTQIPTPIPANQLNTTTAGSAKEITKNTDAKVSEGNKAVLVDRKQSTVWTSKKADAKIQIKFKSSATGLYVEWAKENYSFTLTERGKDGEIMSTRTESDYFPCLKTYFEINPEARGIEFTFPQAGASIAELYVLSGGPPPTTKQMWQAPHEKAEILVIAANYGDEFLYFGGLLPKYQVVDGVATQLVFVSNYNRQIKEQALDALWEAGIRNYPIFLDYPYEKGKSLNDVVAKWSREKSVVEIAELIRRFKPSVVVTNSLAGEDNDGARAATAQFVQEAVSYAADETYDPTSAQRYGAWLVDKLYMHLSEENPVTMDWTVSSSALKNQSPMGAARTAYGKYTSLTSSRPFSDGGQYDNSKFGLVYSEVGADVAGGDFLENLSSSTFADDDVNYADENELDDLDIDALNSMLSATAEPEPTPEPTPEPSPTPEPTGFGIREDLKGLRIFLIVLLVLALLVAAVLGANIILKKQGIDLELYRRVNRVLHGKSFKLPPKRVERDYYEVEDEADEEDEEF